MKVELKGLKVAEFASHETLCFEANIYLDGRRVGSIGNDGNGGPALMHIENDTDRGRLNDWAAELGEDLYRPVPGADGQTLTAHLADVLTEMAAEMAEARARERKLRGRIFFRRSGATYKPFSWDTRRVAYTQATGDALRAELATSGQTVVILNENPDLWGRP